MSHIANNLNFSTQSLFFILHNIKVAKSNLQADLIKQSFKAAFKHLLNQRIYSQSLLP